MLLILAAAPFPGINAVYHDQTVQALEKKLNGPKTFEEQIDSVCRSVGVPTDLIMEIGQNESNWQWQRRGAFGDYGDLQVIPSTFQYWYQKLNLQGGKSRMNYLIVGVHYLKYQYDLNGSWRKARYAYGRGRWKHPSKWTRMEREFMQKIDFRKYDLSDI